MHLDGYALEGVGVDLAPAKVVVEGCGGSVGGGLEGVGGVFEVGEDVGVVVAYVGGGGVVVECGFGFEVGGEDFVASEGFVGVFAAVFIVAEVDGVGVGLGVVLGVFGDVDVGEGFAVDEGAVADEVELSWEGEGGDVGALGECVAAEVLE